MAQNKPSRPMGHGRIAEKPKNFKKSVKNLMLALKGSYFKIIIALIFAIAGTLLTIFIPSLIQNITNIISAAVPVKDGDGFVNLGQSVDLPLVLNLCLVVGLFLALSFIFSYVQSLIMASVTQRLTKKMRADILIKINNLPLKFIDSKSNGDVLSIITNDVDTIGQSLSESITTFVVSVVQILGVTIIMFITNWILAICAIVSAFIGFLLVGLIMSKSQKFFRLQQHDLGMVNGHIEEIYGAHTLVRVTNAKEEKQSEFVNLNKNLYSHGWKAQFISSLMGPLMGFIGNLGFVVVSVAGAVLVANNMVDGIGVIVAFMMLVRLFSSPLTQLAQITSSIQTAAAASERVFDFLGEKELENEENKTLNLNPNGDVVFSHVKFAYTPNKPVIKDFSALIKAGSKVAIVGPTGAGKTTIVNLLMRFYEVDEGEILIGGTNIKDVSRETLHNFFGMVLQDSWIFNGSIKDNIRFNQPDVTDQEIELACQACELDYYIKTRPEGYNTILDENTSISAGQRQLLTIARAMVFNAPMLILDEATSSVDTRTEQQIANAMDKLMAGRTSFVIAHRLSTIKNADLILVIKNGDIVEQGNHQELLNKKGEYYALYNSQFEE